MDALVASIMDGSRNVEGRLIGIPTEMDSFGGTPMVLEMPRIGNHGTWQACLAPRLPKWVVMINTPHSFLRYESCVHHEEPYWLNIHHYQYQSINLMLLNQPSLSIVHQDDPEQPSLINIKAISYQYQSINFMLVNQPFLISWSPMSYQYQSIRQMLLYHLSRTLLILFHWSTYVTERYHAGCKYFHTYACTNISMYTFLWETEWAGLGLVIRRATGDTLEARGNLRESWMVKGVANHQWPNECRNTMTNTQKQTVAGWVGHSRRMVLAIVLYQQGSYCENCGNGSKHTTGNQSSSLDWNQQVATSPLVAG